ncbi:MAG: hypothetical protein Q9227_009324 [Pyrenula ochraceoflavens]
MSGLGGFSLNLGDNANKKRSMFDTTTSGPSLNLPSFSFSQSTQPASQPASLASNQNPTQTNSGGLNLPSLNSFSAQQNQSQAQAPAQSTQQKPGEAIKESPAYFNTLLERGKKRSHRDTKLGSDLNARLGRLPGISLGLADLTRRAQEIGGRGSRPGTPDRAGQNQGHHILAGSGVQPWKALREFQQSTTSEAPIYVPPLDSFDPDNAKYIQGLQDRGREAMIQESLDRVNREVDEYIEESLAINFDEQRQRIMEHFGLIPKENQQDSDPNSGSFGRSTRRTPNGLKDSTPSGMRSMFGRSGLEKSLIGTPGTATSTTNFFGDQAAGNASIFVRGAEDRFLRDKEQQFAEKVKQLNHARDRRQAYPILNAFVEVEDKASGQEPQQVRQSYYALREIVGEGATRLTGTEDGIVKERQYASAYLDESPRSAKALQLRKRIVDGSRRYLEKLFFDHLVEIVNKNPKESQPGGQPDVLNRVAAYVRLRGARKDLAQDDQELQQFNGEFSWALIFYLLRCGFVDEAASYVSKNENLKSADPRFVTYMSAYSRSPDRRLDRRLQEMINGEYQQRSRYGPDNSIDPYRMACYKIIGRCDLTRRNLDIPHGVDDFIWLQFALAREVDRSEEMSADAFGLEQICETVEEIGQKHFQKGNESGGGYGTFFFMQILAGMFEKAVTYLHSLAPVSAIHFAIALAFYGLLRISDAAVAGNELLTFTTTQQPQLNFVPLIAYYTPPFRTADPLAAVHYLILISLNADLPGTLGSIQTNYCHETLRQLCLETREYALLLGDMKADGERIPGVIEKLGRLIQLDTHQDFLRAVTTQAAALADERGQISDAVLLYHLSEDYEAVIQIFNRALADAVTIDLGDSPLELLPLKPRSTSQNGTGEASVDTGSSLSLVSTTDVLQLSLHFGQLYSRHGNIWNLISSKTRTTFGALRDLCQARRKLEAQNSNVYTSVIDDIAGLDIFPLKANGSIPAIRSSATTFASLDPLLARAAGSALLWCLICISNSRESIESGAWDYGRSKEESKTQLNNMAKDLMVFAGMVRYRLPSKVFDMLAQAGGEVGAY